MTTSSPEPKLFFLITTCVSLLLVGALAWWWSPSLTSSNDSAALIKVDPIQQMVDKMGLRQKLASLLVLHAPGTDPQAVAKLVADYQPGGIILMGDNIPPTAPELRRLTAAAQQSAAPLPIFVATDEEGCTVKRLPWDNFPCAPALGSLPVSNTAKAYADRSGLLKQVGINLNFGIVADVTANPDAFIFPRVFGGDSKTVANHVAAAVNGSKGLTFSTLKHFPGHGQTLADSHVVIPTISETQSTWLNDEALPFKFGIKSGANVIMFGHLIYSDIDGKPASLSRKWHDILSRDLGFKGIAITDDLLMLSQSKRPEYQDVIENTVAALQAGNQLVLLVNDHDQGSQLTHIDISTLLDGLVQAVQHGSLREKDVDSAVYQTLKLRSSLPAKN